jgi:peptidoglycan/xylan/chitin deacetylase (PgdA/CDA1 family)
MAVARQAPALEPLGYGTREQPVDARHLVEERYAPRSRSTTSLTLYYRLKPLIPRAVQIALRRALARRLRRRHERQEAFPRWPVEPALVEAREAHLRDRLRRSSADQVPFIGLWPDGHRFAYVLTHDVEGSRGLENVRRVLEVERRHGMVSAWNLVAEDYAIDPTIVEAIKLAGGEIGLHGLTHDGRLFENRASFELQLPRIHEYLRAWGAEGFRSPATHRDAAWMPELGCAYDSSFPDTDPFEPQPGGCCSILPYFMGDLVELPITLVQDHTLFEILRESDIRLWRDKATWIAGNGGLVTVLVHPDYMTSDERLRRYDELLRFLGTLEGGWHALPRDVARWWRRRAALENGLAGGEAPDAAALARAGASIAWARERDGELEILHGQAPPEDTR